MWYPSPPTWHPHIHPSVPPPPPPLSQQHQQPQPYSHSYSHHHHHLHPQQHAPYYVNQNDDSSMQSHSTTSISPSETSMHHYQGSNYGKGLKNLLRHQLLRYWLNSFDEQRIEIELGGFRVGVRADEEEEEAPDPTTHHTRDLSIQTEWKDQNVVNDQNFQNKCTNRFCHAEVDQSSLSTQDLSDRTMTKSMSIRDSWSSVMCQCLVGDLRHCLDDCHRQSQAKKKSLSSLIISRMTVLFHHSAPREQRKGSSVLSSHLFIVPLSLLLSLE